MDTGTHVVMGIALGGIATLDPVVGSDPAMAHAVMIATLVLLRLRILILC